MGRLLAVAAALLGLLLGAGPATAAQPGFRWPLPGTPVVERPFTPPATAWGSGHRGVDLPAAPGTPVLSAGPGQVSYAGVLAGRGVVTVTHAGGLRTTYEPVDASVRVGQQVAAGAVLGRLGTGHASCRTTCLHWGLLRGDAYLDPLSLLAAPALRLLPLGTAAGAAPPAAAEQELPGAAPGANPGAGPQHAAAAAPDAPAGGSLTAAEPPAGGMLGSPGRRVATAAAGGSLVLGLGLLVGRPAGPAGPAAPGPGGGPAAPVDLRTERARRRQGRAA